MPKFMPSANWALAKKSGPELIREILSEIAEESRKKGEARADLRFAKTSNPDSWTHDPFRTGRGGKGGGHGH